MTTAMKIYNYNHQTHQWDGGERVGRDCWVNKNGDIFNCTAHELYAEYIVSALYNKEMECYGDYLIELGWVKFTTSCMNEIYKENGLYKNLTEEQLEIYEQYFDF